MRRRLGGIALGVLLVMLACLSTYAVTSTDGWYHDLYCAGKIDKFDPWCP